MTTQINDKRIGGSITALITPFRDGAVDEAAYEKLINWQLAQGTHGLVPCGSTGEAQTLSHEEHRRLIALCVEVTAGRVPVIAGCGSNATTEAIGLIHYAEKIGADAALVVVPYYNKPTQEGLYAHYKMLHDNSSLPIIIYNIPGRSGVDMALSTFQRLRALPRIIGVKDATADLTRPARYRRALGADFLLLSGEDPTIVPYLAHGGHGCISVSSNIAPGPLARLHDAWAAGNWAEVRAIDDKLIALHEALFVETNPGPVKYAAALLGLCRDELRLPLVRPAEAAQKVVRAALEEAGLMTGAQVA